MKLVPGLLGALTALALAVPTLASAETTTLKFAMPGAAHDEHYERVLIPWAKKVEKESNGMIAIQFFVGPRLANFGNMIDRELLAMGLPPPSRRPSRQAQPAGSILRSISWPAGSARGTLMQ